MTRDPREALGEWITSTEYTHGEIGALFGVTRHAVRQWLAGNVRVPARVQRRLAAEGWLVIKRPRRQSLNHTPLCPPGQPCRSCTNRRWRQANAASPPPPRRDLWTAEQLARLAALAGHEPTPNIAIILTAEFGIPRTPGAVHDRLVRLGLSAQTHLLAVSEVARWCAVDPTTVLTWIGRGVIAAEQPGKRHSPYIIRPPQFETFLRVHYPMLRWQAMPASRWRDLVEMLWRRDPIYTLAEAAAWTGIARTTLRVYCQRGELRGERVTQRSGRGCSWRVRRSALVRFQVRRPSSLGNRNNPASRPPPGAARPAERSA